MTREAVLGGREDDLRAILSDEVAFRRWYDRTLPAVYSYLASRCQGDEDLARELTQQTFVAAIAARSSFDGRSEPVTWLCGIARHKLADHYRRLEREERKRIKVQVREIRPESDPGVVSGFEERAAIDRALAALPVAQRAVLVFVAVDGLPVAEASRLIGRSFGATQSLLARAREGFKRAYDREAGDD